MATNSAFYGYFKKIKLTVDTTDYLFSAWDLTVLVDSYTGSDQIAEQQLDGSWRQRIDGFHISVNFSANMPYNGNDHLTAKTGLEALRNFGSGVIDLDPIDDAGNKTLAIVGSTMKGMAKTIWKGHVANRPMKFSLVTTDHATIPQWLMDEVINFTYEGTDTQFLLMADRGITQAGGLVTAWADQSAASNDITTTSALDAVGDAFGRGVTPKAGALTAYGRTAGNQPLSAASGVSGAAYFWMVVRHDSNAGTGDTLLDITDTAGTNWTSIDLIAGVPTVKDSDGSILSGASGIGNSETHLIEVSVDLSTDTVQIYVDGVLEGTKADWTGDLSGTLSATHYIQIGGDAAKRDAAYNSHFPFTMIDDALPNATRILGIRMKLAKQYGIIKMLSD